MIYPDRCHFCSQCMSIIFCLYSNGAGRTGVFLALCLSIERLETEDNVDIFQTVRWLKSQRAGLVTNSVSRWSK